MRGQRVVRASFESMEERRLMSVTLAVTSSDDLAAQRGTLRWAVAKAQDGDTILLTPAIQGAGITLSQGDLLLTQQQLTIKTVGNTPVTISGGNHSRIFELASSANVTLINLNITGGNGLASNGVTESHPNRGGGIVVDAGASLAITGSSISNNSAGFFGGAIENFGTLSLTHSTLSGNSAGNGGGGFFNLSHMILIDSVISNNSASAGGGIYNSGGAGAFNSGTLAMSGCTISDNSATFGGGIYNFGHIAISEHTSLSGNSAQYGGGIYNNSSGSVIGGGMLSVSDSALSGNTALGGSGGGIYNAGTLAVSRSTLANNSATYDGGAIANFQGSVTVSNATLDYNSAFAGGAISSFAFDGFGTPAVVSVSNTDISHNAANGSDDLDGLGIGGGIYNQSGDVSLNNCMLGDNHATLSGGGIYTIVGGNFTISGGTVSDNSALSGSGGGIYNVSNMDIHDACALSGNTAGVDGGGILNLYNLIVDHCSLSSNSAGNDGGGIYNLSFFGDTGLTLSSSNLSGNTAQFGGGIYNRSALLFIAGSTFLNNTPDDILGLYDDGGGNNI